MAKKEPKLSKKGAVSRIRGEANKLRKQPVPPALRDIFQKRKEPQKKIARSKRGPDLGL
jgi:hypothetical protein